MRSGHPNGVLAECFASLGITPVLSKTLTRTGKRNPTFTLAILSKREEKREKRVRMNRLDKSRTAGGPDAAHATHTHTQSPQKIVS
eukprot:3937925-Amphidinium_carterae.1